MFCCDDFRDEYYGLELALRNYTFVLEILIINSQFLLCICFFRSIAIIKSDKDTRYGMDSIVTHDGVKLPCWALSELISFRHKFGADAYEQVFLSPRI